MNTFHQIIWRAATQSWVAVSEIATSQRKKSSTTTHVSGAVLVIGVLGALNAQACTVVAG